MDRIEVTPGAIVYRCDPYTHRPVGVRVVRVNAATLELADREAAFGYHVRLAVAMVALNPREAATRHIADADRDVDVAHAALVRAEQRRDVAHEKLRDLLGDKS